MKDKTWFVFDYYSQAGAPKLETYMADAARKLFLYHTVDEADFPNMVKTLVEIQDRASLGNPRLKKVDIRMGESYAGFTDDLRRLHIGNQHSLSLRLSKGHLTFDKEA